MMYYMIAELQPDGVVALRCPLTSIYGLNYFSFFFFTVFFSFPPIQCCKEEEEDLH